MNLKNKINAEIANVSKNVRITADNYKLDCKIAQQQKRIKELVNEIGTLALIRLDDGAEMFPEIMERYQAIEEARTAIAELKSEKKTTKAVCPECGMKTSLDMNYCGKCGAKLPVLETEEAEASERAAVDCASAEAVESVEEEANCAFAEKTESTEEKAAAEM